MPSVPIKSTIPSSEVKLCLLVLPNDLQVNILTYLRAFDLCAVQKSCKFYAKPELIDSVVSHFAERIYPSEWTVGFEAPHSAPKGKNNTSKQNLKQSKTFYTFEHLRNMEILVVARALNSPEPNTGFIVSKSWIKTTLRWLDAQQEQAQQPKKMSKKKQRLRDRKLSDASPPWPNANIDLLCEHQNLQCCTNGKSTRARRRILDRQAWKILKKLYPDSTQLESALGECLQCTLETEMAKKSEADRAEKEKLERQRPLADPDVRRFFKRRTGVPSQSINPMASLGQCPFKQGEYYVVPRSWCYAWRRYVKTGEGGTCSPPDASILLCHAHRLALLPPHLEAYLCGDSPDLLAPQLENLLSVEEGGTAAVFPDAPPQLLIPNRGPDRETLEALRAAGIVAEVDEQINRMRELEDLRAPAAFAAPFIQPGTSANRNEQLDSENYSVVEILTEAEYLALERCWSWHGFSLGFTVDEKGVMFRTTQTCRECDATGRQHLLHIKNRSRKAIRKSAEKGRVPASLEY